MKPDDKKKPNDLHMHIGESLVMVQWGLPNGPYENVAMLTAVTFRNREPHGGSINLSTSEREKLIEALQGKAPPCSCRVCIDDAKFVGGRFEKKP